MRLMPEFAVSALRAVTVRLPTWLPLAQVSRRLQQLSLVRRFRLQRGTTRETPRLAQAGLQRARTQVRSGETCYSICSEVMEMSSSHATSETGLRSGPV